MANVYVITADWFSEAEGIDESNVFIGVTANWYDAVNIVRNALEDHEDDFKDPCCICDELEDTEKGYWHYKDDSTECWYTIEDHEI